MQEGNLIIYKPNIFVSARQEIQQHLLLREASLKPPLLFWVWAWLLIFCFSLFNHYFLIQIAIRSQKWKWEILYSKCFVSKISSQFVLYDILCSGLNQLKNSNIWFDQHLPKSFQCKLLVMAVTWRKVVAKHPWIWQNISTNYPHMLKTYHT